MAPKLIKLHDRMFIRGHTRGVSVQNLLRTLHEHNIYFVLNVALIVDPEFAEAARAIGMIYRHEPLSDSTKRGIPEVNDLIQLARNEMDRHGVLVHCDSGYNRSALIAIPAVALCTGKKTDLLVEEARKQRPLILKNPTFEEFVLKWQNR